MDPADSQIVVSRVGCTVAQDNRLAGPVSHTVINVGGRLRVAVPRGVEPLSSG